MSTEIPGTSAEIKIAIRTTWFSILGNAVLALLKMLGGILGNSYALVADAVESTTDIFSSLLLLFGIKYSSRPADENHPYGHGKAEPLLTFLVVGFLIASATVIGYESVIHIRQPHALPEVWTLFILGPLIAWKEISYRLVIKKGKETHSSALVADAWHHRSDAITSVAAFIGISIALITGYEGADDWAALLASFFILYNSFLIFRPALGEIMDEHRYDDMIGQIRKIASGVDGITGTEKCYVRKAGMKYFVDLHATVNGNLSVRDGHEIAHKLKDAVMQDIPFISDILIHIEPA